LLIWSCSGLIKNDSTVLGVVWMNFGGHTGHQADVAQSDNLFLWNGDPHNIVTDIQLRILGQIGSDNADATVSSGVVC
jgi:hypothetical protein